ncbi:hypothetical protein PQE75_gp197 [Bacillus phage vB_BcoS-136]|uniref:Uncharacterized protein n=1 Tax=Bacillus phage vB_BcoS-136 TaxID=2419619 RepID=A0A3G3BVJ0_9CAUD|nr:hypothetical protein PQE75_gp197 [Bacillus phage vB_BcoS-136]AYP68282.1 hypothetical protein vBBcoS136_00168 [Bacillus phage vB_BcoS-136]
MKVGDIVIITEGFDKSNPCYYIVVDLADFSTSNIKDVDYEIVQVYPVDKSREADIRVYNHVFIERYVGIDNKNSYRAFMEYVSKEREKLGLYGKPDYLSLIEDLHDINVFKAEKNLDVVHYNKIDNVDECLDAISDLKTLHEMFGDEAYLQLKDLVIERIKDLQK